MDQRLDKLADVLVNYSTGVRPGELVVIRLMSPIAAPLAVAVQRHVLMAGAHPAFYMNPSQAEEVQYLYGSDAQIGYVDPLFLFANKKSDVMIHLLADANTMALNNIEPAKITINELAYDAITKVFMRRQTSGALRWNVTQYPCAASAQDAGMSLTEYEDFVYGACMLDLKDPVGYWKKVAKEQARLVDYLKGKERIEVRGDNIDLSMSIKGRTFLNGNGTTNMPDGEIFTGPVEDSVNGWVRFTYPAIYNAHEVQGVEIAFKDGKAVHATASSGLDFLTATLDTDKGSRYLGEFAIATNEGITNFTRNILFDEKIAGTVHVAFGASYPNSGGRNESTIHWDMICDMRSGSEIHVDGKLFYKNGKFKV
jgi:aminopeptidase